MSGLADTWAKAQTCPSSRAKDALKTLASWADAEGSVWLLVDVLAFEMGCDARTAQRGLAALKRARLLIETGEKKRYNGRLLPIYRLPIEEGPANTIIALKALRAAANPTATGDTGVTPSEPSRVTPVSPHGCQPCHPTGDTGVTQIGKGNIKPKHSERGRAGASAEFEEARAGYPLAGVRGVSGHRQGEAAWAAEVEQGADPAAIVAACRAYAGLPGDWGASGKPKAFHNFLSSGAWRDYANGVRGSDQPQGSPGSWVGPAEVRAAFVAMMGEAWAVSWLDPCGWEVEGRCIVARTGIAARRIEDEGRRVLAEFKVQVRKGDA